MVPEDGIQREPATARVPGRVRLRGEPTATAFSPTFQGPHEHSQISFLRWLIFPLGVLSSPASPQRPCALRFPGGLLSIGECRRFKEKKTEGKLDFS